MGERQVTKVTLSANERESGIENSIQDIDSFFWVIHGNKTMVPSEAELLKLRRTFGHRDRHAADTLLEQFGSGKYGV